MKKTFSMLFQFSCFPLLGFSEPLYIPLKGSPLEYKTVTITQLPEYEVDRAYEEQKTEFLSIPYDLPVESISDTHVHDIPLSALTRPVLASPAPTVSFQALDDSRTVIPPDTHGAVGVNHLVTMLNDRVRIHSKTGGVLRTVSLSSFWQVSSAQSPFDPRIMYDPFANRWVGVVLIDARKPSSAFLIAVSQTSDPMGTWNIYTIKADPTATTTSGVWADFPNIGFNNKWIVIQLNMFNIVGNSFNRSHVYVFDKANLYAGGAGNFKLFSLPGIGGTQVPALTYDSVLPTLYLLQNWNGSAGGNGYLRLYAINGPLGGETFSAVGFVAINQPWASFHPVINGGFAPQLGTPYRIMNNDARVQNVVYRNGSLWTTQTVFLPAASPLRSAIQWWQINPSTAVQQFGRIDDSTATSAAGNFYAFPSIAVNASNDALIGYSRFNPAWYASAAYSFRFGTELNNTLRGSTFLKNGEDFYIKDFGTGQIRWGDYSATLVDPNNQDFWILQEYADKRTLYGESRWATWWGKIEPSRSI